MRLARYIQRPNFFRPPRYGPVNDLSSQRSIRSNSSWLENDLSDDKSTQSNNANGGSIEANEVLVELTPVTPKTPAALAKAPAKAKEKKAKKVAFGDIVLGDKPIWPKVAALPKLPLQEEMFLGKVSTNKSGSEAKGLLVEANDLIRRIS